MNGRALGLAALAVASLAAAVADDPAAAPGASRGRASVCRFSLKHTIVATKTVRVFTGNKAPRDDRPTFACRYGSRRRVLLGVDGFESYITKVTVSGVRVAAFDQYAGRQGAWFRVIVGDVRSGRVSATPFNSVSGYTGPLITGRALVLSSTGATAWIAETIGRAPPQPASFSVEKRDAAGLATLQSGSDIDPGSLAVSGQTVYWTRAGQPQRYVLQQRSTR